MFGRHTLDELLIVDLSVGVVGVAEPQCGFVLFFLEAGAGVLIFAECGGWDDWLELKSLCDEVDGLGSPVGDDDTMRVDAVALGQHCLQRPRLRLRVVADEFGVAGQMGH